MAMARLCECGQSQEEKQRRYSRAHVTRKAKGGRGERESKGEQGRAGVCVCGQRRHCRPELLNRGCRARPGPGKTPLPGGGESPPFPPLGAFSIAVTAIAVTKPVFRGTTTVEYRINDREEGRTRLARTTTSCDDVRFPPLHCHDLVLLLLLSTCVCLCVMSVPRSWGLDMTHIFSTLRLVYHNNDETKELRLELILYEKDC